MTEEEKQRARELIHTLEWGAWFHGYWTGDKERRRAKKSARVSCFNVPRRAWHRAAVRQLGWDI